MQVTRTRSKYYLLSVLGALVLAVGVLAVAPSAQAQVVPEPPSIDKECTPNPVQVGQTLTCTIDVVPALNTLIFVRVEDTLPDGLTVIGATSEIQPVGASFPCTVAGNTVTCPAPQTVNITTTPFSTETFSVTIEARAERCGTFQNTATAVVPLLATTVVPLVDLRNQRYQDTEQINVVGCEEAGGGGAGGTGGAGGGGGGAAAPITQEGDQESDSGEVGQSFDVS